MSDHFSSLGRVNSNEKTHSDSGFASGLSTTGEKDRFDKIHSQVVRRQSGGAFSFRGDTLVTDREALLRQATIRKQHEQGGGQ